MGKQMTDADKILGKLDRIIELLEGKKDDRQQKNGARARKNIQPGHGRTDAQQLIATYCEAYKSRWGSNPIIDGKSAGLAANLLRAIPLEKAQVLVQAYCQMSDDWFKTRAWDFPTFTQNLNKVALALANGTNDPHEKQFWEKVFGRGAEHGKGMLRAADEKDDRNMERKELPSGKTSAPVEGF